MRTHVDIHFRAMDPSKAVEAAVHKWVARLEQTFDRIEDCSVVIEIPHNHHRQGKTFQVHITLAVPGRTIVVSRDPGADHRHEDLYVAIADAFRAARRQLQDHARCSTDFHGRASLVP